MKLGREKWYRRSLPLVWRKIGSFDVVFDPATGQTHFLNSLPSVILANILDQPTDIHALSQRVGASIVEMPASEALKFRQSLDLLVLSELIEISAARAAEPESVISD